MAVLIIFPVIIQTVIINLIMLSIELNIGTPVTSALWNVQVNFSFSRQADKRTDSQDL